MKCMKRRTIVLLSLAAAVSICSIQLLSAEAIQDAITTIMTRCSVRSYLDKPVEDEKITVMLKAAMAAPTAVNRQPWAFVVIRKQEVKTKLAEKLRSAAMVEKAPLAVLVCGDLNKRLKGDGADFWIQDVSAATENLLLAAHAQGLGAVWCGVFPVEERVKDVRSILELPDHIVPVALVSIGYPDGPQTPKDKWNESLIHYDKW